MGRKENFDVIEVLVVDSKGQRLIANPAHGGEQMTEEY